MKDTAKILILLFVTVLCVWEDPIPIEGAFSKYTQGLFVDNITKSTYIFYGKNTYNDSNVISYLCFKKYNSEDKLIQENCIHQSRMIEDIAAVGKGDNLYVVFKAHRRKGGNDCSPDNTDGCDDVYFTESADGGKNWKKPFPIPRENNLDPVSRTSPSIILVEETHRLFVAYSYYLPGGKKTIKFSTRSLDSSVFSLERNVVDCEGYTPEKAQLTYRKENEKIQLQIFYYVYGDFYVAHSNTNGIMWYNEKLAAVPEKFSYSVAVSSDKQRVFVALRLDDKFALCWQEEDLLWHNRIYAYNKQYNTFVPFITSIPGNNNGMLFTSYMEHHFPSTYILDIEYEELYNLQEEPPNAEIRISAFLIDGDKKRVRVLTQFEDDLFLSTYRFNE